MSNAKVSAALAISRSLLGDNSGTKWTDAILFPNVLLAHGELVAKLVLNGISSEIKTTTRLTLASGLTSLGNLEPSDIIRIISISELEPSAIISTAVPMTKREQIPNIDQIATLRYWSYNLEILTFLGATADRDVIITYFREAAAPTEVNSLLDFKGSEIFIGPRVAALATAMSDARFSQLATQMAEDNLSKIVRIQVKGDQNLPVRRRPFSAANRRSSKFV